MKTTLKNEITVKEICDGFVYNELEGKERYSLPYDAVIMSNAEYIELVEK